MFELSGNAHRHRQIVVAHPGDVDAGHGDDLIQMLEGFRGLQQKNYRVGFVGLREKLRTTGLICIVSDS